MIFKLDAIPIVDENDIFEGTISKTDIIKAVFSYSSFTALVLNFPYV
ncbi:MAG: hypothetical protein U5K55_16935 [Aliarcobacter sp.]|nr:hypothetical protein [Aliarcobacter sp.]